MRPPEPPVRLGIVLVERARRPSEFVRPRDFRAPPPAGFFFRVEGPRSAAEPQLVVRRVRPSSGYRGGPWSASSRVAGIEGGWSLQFFLFRHHRDAPPALLTAPAETLLRDVVLARPAVFAGLTYEGLLANGLSHGLALVSSVDARSRLIGLRTCAIHILAGPRPTGRPITNARLSAGAACVAPFLP